MSILKRPVGVFYNHPTAYRSFFDLLLQKKIPFIRIKSTSHQYNPAEQDVPFSILLNLTNPELSGNQAETEYIADYLLHIERLGVLILNGALAHRIFASQVRQLELIASLGLNYPKTRILNHHEQILPAALTFNYPVMIKPNGINAGRNFILLESPADLQKAIANHQIDSSTTGTLLVQEILPAQEKSVIRLITVNGSFRVAYKIPFQDYSRPSRSLRGTLPLKSTHTEWRSYTPPTQLVDDVVRISKTGKIQFGFIDCLLNTQDQTPYYLKIGNLDPTTITSQVDKNQLFDSLSLAVRDNLLPAFESDLIQEAW